MNQGEAKKHLDILASRVGAFEKELEAAFRNGKVITERIKSVQSGLATIHKNRNERLREIETKFEADFVEQENQIKLAEDVLSKKKEERQSLMDYLNGFNLSESSVEELRDFDWCSMQKFAVNLHQIQEGVLEQNRKAETLCEQNQLAKQHLVDLNELLVSAELIKDRFEKVFKEFKSHNEIWLNFRQEQEKRIFKLQTDNERLNILIRQFVSSDEHMPEYITKNVQAKCQSFLRSESVDELLDGLKKFKARQERVIHLLQYKDNQLGSETNKLEVAKDQTHDQVKFYLNLIASRRDVHLNKILGPNPTNQEQQQTNRNYVTGA